MREQDKHDWKIFGSFAVSVVVGLFAIHMSNSKMIEIVNQSNTNLVEAIKEDVQDLKIDVREVRNDIKDIRECPCHLILENNRAVRED